MRGRGSSGEALEISQEHGALFGHAVHDLNEYVAIRGWEGVSLPGGYTYWG